MNMYCMKNIKSLFRVVHFGKKINQSLLHKIPKEFITTLKFANPPLLIPIIYKAISGSYHVIEEVEGDKITKAQVGHIDPQTKAIITTKGSIESDRQKNYT